VLANESLGGEGKIRVFYSTTSASDKFKKDKIALENLLRVCRVAVCVCVCKFMYTCIDVN